jgi:hypothetical protein
VSCCLFIIVWPAAFHFSCQGQATPCEGLPSSQTSSHGARGSNAHVHAWCSSITTQQQQQRWTGFCLNLNMQRFAGMFLRFRCHCRERRKGVFGYQRFGRKMDGWEGATGRWGTQRRGKEKMRFCFSSLITRSWNSQFRRDGEGDDETFV